jgi:phosphatidylserine/phosphatidylglycerophosphate/cardiolipin synthase-like enzyme
MPHDEVEMDQVLKASLDDHRLSRVERRALIYSLGPEATSAATRALWRGRAFDLVRGLPNEPKALDWLEEVVRALDAAAVRQAATAEVVTSHARFSPGDACLREIVHRFDQARRSVDICVFTITDDRITNAILEAQRRKIALRLITDDRKSADLGSDVELLVEAGISVRTDRRPAHMHHKFAIFDGAFLLNGSYNWTRGAALENSENLITTSDPGLIRDFQEEFNRIWKAFG